MHHASVMWLLYTLSARSKRIATLPIAQQNLGVKKSLCPKIHLEFEKINNITTICWKFLGPGVFPIPSMGLVYLPTWMVHFYGFHVGKYTVRPMDCLGCILRQTNANHQVTSLPPNVNLPRYQLQLLNVHSVGRVDCRHICFAPWRPTTLAPCGVTFWPRFF